MSRQRAKIYGIFLLLIAVGAACKRKNEPNKILDGLPVSSPQTVVPAQITEIFFLLQRDGMSVIIAAVNRLNQVAPKFPEFSGPTGAAVYSFTTHENHYGTANFTIQFRDISDAVIDPIQAISSSSTLRSILVTTTGGSNDFSYTQNLTLTLEVAGSVTLKKRMTGTSIFTGSTYSMTFTPVPPGPNCTFEGLTDGSINAAGTGGTPAQNTTVSLSFLADHTANGSISWEGTSGGLHLESNGTGYIVTNDSRILFN